MQSTELTSMLASASPDQRRLILGERLYPLVERLCDAESAPKVTGMILQMDVTEVLLLLDSQKDLKNRVDEAVALIRHQQQPVAAEPQPQPEGEVSQ